MSDDDEKHILTLLKLARVLGFFCAGVGFFGIYVLLREPATILMNTVMIGACAGSFYMAKLCLIDGSDIITSLSEERAERQKRKSDWISKFTRKED